MISDTNRNGEIIAWHYATRRPVRLRWETGVLTTVGEAQEAPENMWVAPALVDLQVNGYAGIDFQQDNLSVADLVKAAEELQTAGCGRFLLTLVTDEWPRLMRRLTRLRELRAQSPFLQEIILGWHIEGPFLSEQPGYCGAHKAEFMCDPKPELIEELRRITGDDPVLLTLAPERPGAIAAIAQAVRLRMKVSLGHTNAPTETIWKAIDAGATGFTHLGNGCPQELDRHDNVLWRVFEIASAGIHKTAGAPLTVSLIPDQIHVSPALFRLIHRLLPEQSILYVTDAMAAAGARAGRYKLGPLELEVGEDQVVRLPGHRNYAGSALRAIDAVMRASQMLKVDWQEVWPRLSENPARFMGLDMGLRVGRRAKFSLVEVTAQGIVSVQVIG